MKENNTINITKGVYLLPWSEKDNPNGWIEPTTFCQLKCPGCYRGLDKKDYDHIHEDFLELKKQIDNFLVNRNIQTLSIAGGEPLLYPKINELVSYANNNGLRVMIYTNGLALTEEKIRELKNSGATQFVLHIDKFQGRVGYNNENDLLKLRDKYCNLFRKVGGVNLGFIQPIAKDNLKDINLLLDFYNRNIDIVNLVVFTLYREVCWDHAVKPNIDTNISVEDVVIEIRQRHKYEACSYLGSNKSINDPTWLFSIKVGINGYLFGFLDGKIYKLIQERYRKNKGKYLFLTRKNKINILKLLRYFNFTSILKIVFKYLKKKIINPLALSNTVYFQTMLILRGPEKQKGEWDLCQGCPDAMFYKDKLVPSCILEEIKKKK
ncbi:MAG: radical SAM protein [bacterium]|nr:radical SAM protein [bacterium]